MLLWSRCTLAFLDDKHIKVGEPGFPVAALDGDKPVMVEKDMVVKIGDHDFTKCKLTPSIIQLCEIPETTN